jgi:adhesin HecA-like repeat protein
MDLRYTALTHSAGTFSTYGSDGLYMTGGSLTTSGAPDHSFNNEGHMSITDEYGKVGGNNICTIDADNGDLDNDSHWLEYIAAVYSESGLIAAEAAQVAKIATPGEGDLSVYNRLQVLDDITIDTDWALSADFGSYWVGSTWSWDGSQNVQVPATLTINPGKTLTVPAGCNLHAESGIVDNQGTISIFAGGSVDVWPQGTYSNTGAGAIADNGEDNGDFYIRHEYDRDDNEILMPTVLGLGVTPAKFIAMVYTESDLLAARENTDPVYDRIEIKGGSDIELADNLTIDATVYIEPGSGLIVPFEVTLTLTGEHQFDNWGDITVYGALVIGDATNQLLFFNNNNLEIGALTGAEGATVTVSAGSGLINSSGNVTVYANGALGIHGYTNVFTGKTLSIGGEVTVSDTGTLDINGNVSISATGTLDINGDTNVNADGTIVNNGSVTVGAGGTLDASDGSYSGTEPVVDEDGYYFPPEH